MSQFLRSHFQSDSLPPADVVVSSYLAAQKVLHNRAQFPRADFRTLAQLIEELEADPEACQLLP